LIDQFFCFTDRLALQVEAEINLTCFGVDGVDALKAALLAGREAGTEETPITVSVKASPVYTLSAVHIDKAVAVDLLNKAIELVRVKIGEYQSGAMELKSAPKAVTA
jgi:translation initiation factor 2 subunit 1